MSILSQIWDMSVVCIGRDNTDKAGIEGKFFGWIKIDGRKWAIVRWEEDEDPDLYKAELLLISENRMVKIPD